jgi:hypothetical protein
MMNYDVKSEIKTLLKVKRLPSGLTLADLCQSIVMEVSSSPYTPKYQALLQTSALGLKYLAMCNEVRYKYIQSLPTRTVVDIFCKAVRARVQTEEHFGKFFDYKG